MRSHARCFAVEDWSRSDNPVRVRCATVVAPPASKSVTVVHALCAHTESGRPGDEHRAIAKDARRGGFGENGGEKNVCDAKGYGPDSGAVVPRDILHHAQRLA